MHKAANRPPLLLLPCRAFLPSAPPGGTAAEEAAGQGQNPDGDENDIFAGAGHIHAYAN
ncbi:MAG: hypothetical protein H6Q56_419 [Deltaproteobacteria bacterium]|nr:hypothetical protein [Deltaproteobacteria bacterium]